MYFPLDYYKVGPSLASVHGKCFPVMSDYVLCPVIRAICTKSIGKFSSPLKCIYFFIALPHLSTPTVYSPTLGTCTALHSAPAQPYTRQLHNSTIGNCTALHSAPVHLYTRHLYKPALNNPPSSIAVFALCYRETC